MGQILPLPQRIPTPTLEQRSQLENIGFQFGAAEEISNAYFTELTLPTGWRWHNDSWRNDLPAWYVVNADNLAILSVYGAWKGGYDNELNLRVYETPTQVELRSTPGTKPKASPAASSSGSSSDSLDQD